MLSAVDYRKKNLKNSEMLAELEEWAMEIEEVRKALIEWESLSANKENRVVYEARMKELKDLLSNLEGYKRKGREEALKLVARKMLQDGTPVFKIAEITGLSEEDIEKLK